MKKTKKIIALLLSALLCLSVIPFAALADEAAPATSPVTSFPDGKNHSLVYMMENPEYKISNGFSGDEADGMKLDKSASSALVDNFTDVLKTADGIMFKLDNTATAASDATYFSLIIYFSYTDAEGASKTATVCTDLHRAMARNKVSSTVKESYNGATTTWYMTTDNGANWSEINYEYITSGDNKTSGWQCQKVTEDKVNAYIFIPAEAMVCDSDLDNDGEVDSLAEVAALNNFTVTKMSAAANNPTMKESAAYVTDLMFVTPYKPVSAINGQDYSYAYMMQNPAFKYSEGHSVAVDENGMRRDKKATTLASGFVDTFKTADGIMFHLDTTKFTGSAATYFSLGLAFSCTTKADGAVTAVFCTDAHRAAIRKNCEQEAYIGTITTWYMSTDKGATWTEINYEYNDGSTGEKTSGWECQKIADAGQTFDAYIYIPFSEMVCDKDLNDNGEADSYADIITYDDLTFTSICAYANADTMKSADVYVNEFMFVTLPKAEQALDASITLTDDIAYNVYTTLPAGATDDKVTFTMGDKTVEVAGVNANGQRKYSFTGILPQQIGETIDFVWSATVAGETVEIEKSGSVLDYVKAVLADEDLADWHNVAKTLAHYGAAAQAYTGVTEGFVNEGIAAVTPVDRDTLVIAYENSNLAVWTSAALRLDTAITLKIGVAAADGTDVTWAVGGKSGTAKVEDGYVYVSVNAYEITEAIELTCGEDTLTLSASWYLANKNTTDDTVLENLIQAIADYAVAAALKKGNQPVALLSSPTVAQIKLLNNGGMSYVVQMENGHYIVIDGGVQNSANTQYLMNYLIANKTGEKPMIDAWMFTHQHGDHLDNAFYILNNYSDQIEVKRFIYTWGTPDSSRLESAQIDEINNYTTQFNNLRSKYPNTQLISMKQDDIYTIGTVKIHVLITAEQYAAEHSRDGKIHDLNYLSAVFKMTFTQNTLSTDDDTTFMVVGDASYRRLTYLVDRYGSELQCDVLQAAHHGLEGGEKTFYQAVDPDITLVPAYQARYEEWFTTNEFATYYRDYNAWLANNSTCYHSSNTYVVNMETLTVSQWAQN